jgi:hypothetical protein
MTDVDKLVPFTGYYSMNLAPGAFLSIDTVEERSMPSAQPTSPIEKTTNIAISVSMNGTSASVYSFSDGATFDGVLSIRDDLAILFDFSILSGISEEPRQVYSYSYVPAMFVLTFSGEPTSQPSKFTLMLGTAGKNGLACSIQGGATARLAVSILPFDR